MWRVDLQTSHLAWWAGGPALTWLLFGSWSPGVVWCCLKGLHENQCDAGWCRTQRSKQGKPPEFSSCSCFDLALLTKTRFSGLISWGCGPRLRWGCSLMIPCWIMLVHDWLVKAVRFVTLKIWNQRQQSNEHFETKKNLKKIHLEGSMGLDLRGFGLVEWIPLISHDRKMIDGHSCSTCILFPKGPGNPVSNAKIVRVVQGTGDLCSASPILCRPRPLCPPPVPGGWYRQLVALRRNAPEAAPKHQLIVATQAGKRSQEVDILAGWRGKNTCSAVYRIQELQPWNVEMSVLMVRAFSGLDLGNENAFGRSKKQNHRPLAPAFGQRHPELRPTGLETSDKWRPSPWSAVLTWPTCSHKIQTKLVLTNDICGISESLSFSLLEALRKLLIK